jgi:hypothetical protein
MVHVAANILLVALFRHATNRGPWAPVQNFRKLIQKNERTLLFQLIEKSGVGR